MKSIESEFPIINDPEWLERRVTCWQLALDNGEWKKEYRKKDLEKIRTYFFTGKYDESMPLSKFRGSLILLFPIQSEAGFNYFYKQYSFTKAQLESLTRSAPISGVEDGQDEEAQLAYWDYHLGNEFKPKLVRTTADGEVEIELDALKTSKSILTRVSNYLRKKSYSENPKWVMRLDYLFSALSATESFNLDDDGEKYYSDFFTRIIARKFPAGRSPKNYRHTFAAEFEKRMEETQGLPKDFVAIWEKVKREVRSK